MRLVGDVGRDAELELGLPVVRLELAIAQRPVASYAVARPQLEVLREHPQATPSQCSVEPPWSRV